MALDTHEQSQGPANGHEPILPDPADAGVEVPDTEALEADTTKPSHTRRNVLLWGGAILGTGTVGATIAAIVNSGQHTPDAAPASVDTPSILPTATGSKIEAPSASPEIPQGAVSFDTALSGFENMTDAELKQIIETKDLSAAAEVEAILFLDAAQDKEGFVDAAQSAGAEVAAPVYNKNPLFTNMMDKDIKASDLLATAFLGPSLLAYAQSAKGRLVSVGDPLDVKQAERVIDIAWGIGARQSVMLNAALAETKQRINSPASDGSMNVRHLAFTHVLESAAFVGESTTITIGNQTFSSRRVKYFNEELGKDVIGTIIAVPLQKAFYDIPKSSNGIGFKETVLPTKSDGTPVYKDGTQVTIPTLIDISLS